MASQATGTASLLETSKYSDMTGICGNRSWKLHKSVVLVQSELFEKQFEDSNYGTLDLSAEDESGIAATFYFLYHGNYSAETSNPLQRPLLVFHLRVYLIAAKYAVEKLRLAALQQFQDACTSEWDTDSFAQAIEEMYDATTAADHELRRAVLDASSACAARLFSPSQGETKFKQMVARTPVFSADLLQILACSTRVQHCPQPRDVEVDAQNGEEFRRGHDPTRPNMANFIASMADLDEPEEREYNCPRCHASFKARIWAGEKYQHGCGEVVGDRRNVLNMYDGDTWRYRFCSS